MAHMKLFVVLLVGATCTLVAGRSHLPNGRWLHANVPLDYKQLVVGGAPAARHRRSTADDSFAAMGLGKRAFDWPAWVVGGRPRPRRFDWHWQALAGQHKRRYSPSQMWNPMQPIAFKRAGYDWRSVHDPHNSVMMSYAHVLG